MCGIFGYVGKRQAAPLLYEGLKKLEYRGYDSAGIAVQDERGKIDMLKREGRLRALLPEVYQKRGECGVGHTRWATHGSPTELNAHPHAFGKFALVHNGIVENDAELKKEFFPNEKFLSQTDTETIVRLFDRFDQGDLLATAKRVFSLLKGSFAVALLCSDLPQTIFVARRFSPLVVGVGKGEFFLSSDVPALSSFVEEVIPLGEEECALITSDGARFFDREFHLIEKRTEKTEGGRDAYAFHGYGSYMEKEIFESPVAMRSTLSHLLYEADLSAWERAVEGCDKILFVACGTAYHSTLAAKPLFEKFARLSVSCEYASEFRYRESLLGKKTLVVAVSQSGETADTIAAAMLAKAKGATLAVVTNVRASTLSRLTSLALYTYAGAEIGVAATKSYAAQLILLYYLALVTAKVKRGISLDGFVEKLKEVPSLAERTLKELPPLVKELAEKYRGKKNIFLIGRGIDYAVALEGSLKLKEIAYRWSEGYPAGELKHGTLALVEKDTLVVALVTQESTAEKTQNAVNQTLSRGASVWTIATEKTWQTKGKENAFCLLPKTEECFSPLLSVLPIQLFVLYLATLQGLDPDKPRNLAKSVTVE